MRSSRLAWLAFILALSAPCPGWTDGTVATGLHPEALESQVDHWFLEAMDVIYRGRPTEAMAIADRMRAAVPEDPRPYLLKARVLRLDIPDQNADKGLEGPVVEALKDVLEVAVQKSDQILERDPHSVAGHLYRGWASMFQAQIHALAKEYWSAGRKAKSGKDDLDFVLHEDPGNADALMVEGVYLYFADILPGMVKFARVFLRVPGGHRLGGIEYVQAAALRHGYSRLDAEALLGVILFGFEGRLEDAVPVFESILRTYPDNVRILEPLAIISLFLPERMQQEHDRLQETLRTASVSQEAVERKVALRLSYYVALQEMLGGELQSARERLEDLRRMVLAEPDWLEEGVLTSLVDVLRMLGDSPAAAKITATMPERSTLRNRLEKRQQDQAMTPAQAATLLQLQPAIHALYAGNPQDAEAALEKLDGDFAPYVGFYRGEIALLQRDPSRALEEYAKVEPSGPADEWSWFRFFAQLRMAEAHAALQTRGEAAKDLDRALELREQKDLLRHVVRARKRCFENGDEVLPGGMRADVRSPDAAASSEPNPK